MISVSRTRRAGLKLAPILARVLLRKPFVRHVALLEAYAAFIQGKGSGTGWDMHAEAHAAMLNIMRADAVVFDVGAHVGEWSALICEMLGSESRCRVFQFEPLPHNCSVLRSLDLPGTTIIEAAVSNVAGYATLYSPDAWSSVASLHRRRDSQLRHYDFSAEQVKVVTIDEIVRDYDIDYVDFMKLDVEGSELAVLRGSHQLLRSKRIKALTFEFGAGNINSRTYFHDFWDLLRGYGYNIQRICPGGVLLEIEEYYEDLEYFRGVSNYLATANL